MGRKRGERRRGILAGAATGAFLGWWTFATVGAEPKDERAGVGNGGPAAAKADRGTVDETAPLDGLSRLAGEWRAKGDWDDPSKGSIRVVYNFSVNKRAMTGQSFRTAEDEEHKVYETLIGWHPGRKQIVWYSFSAWGAFYEGTATVSGDTVEMDWTDYTGVRMAKWRETLTLHGPDAYEWKVWNQKGEDWVLAKEGRFERVGPEAESPESGARAAVGARKKS